MNIFKIVEQILTMNDKYVSDDGKLLKAKVYNDVITMNKDLLSILLSNEKVKDAFFENINEVLIFDKQKFAWFIESKEFLPNSYTSFTNKIGLTKDGSFINKVNDVVLDFPYKDCVLEGGQSSDEQKRNEIFYNEIIASDEISRMLAPKVFTNSKRYSKDGIEDNIIFNNDDNLIIKGNNLIVLSSLLKRYECKIKCIYIDPPYNTGNDSFNYNDSFNHSTWLTFMKNRLELSKRLLRDDGVIFVQCDDNEQAYLKVLMDEVFGRGNFVNNIAVKMSEPSGIKMSHASRRLPKLKEYVLMYKKDNITLNEVKIPKAEWDNEYKTVITNVNKEEIDFIKQVYKNEKRTEDNIKQVNIILDKAEYMSINALYDELEAKTKKDRVNVNFENAYRIFRTTALGGGTTEAINKSRINNCKNIFFTHITSQNKMYIIKGDYDISMRKPRIQVLFADEYLEYNPCDFWVDIKTTGLDNEGTDNSFKNGKKPEQLIERLLKLATNKSDLILDFHLGSGTTAAVAHKMGRRYIGIEQMDYIEDISVARLTKVIDGEQGGISKALDWNGGGSFVYCELLENANVLIKKVQSATDENIANIKADIYKDERILSYITQKELEDCDLDFNDLSLDEKKQALIRIIDKNKLYVNYSDLEDETFNVNESDKLFTKSFYQEV